MTDGNRLSEEAFMRLCLESEREVLRYVMALVRDASAAMYIVQETVVALWKKRECYDPAFPFSPWACRFAMNQQTLKAVSTFWRAT